MSGGAFIAGTWSAVAIAELSHAARKRGVSVKDLGGIGIARGDVVGVLFNVADDIPNERIVQAAASKQSQHDGACQGPEDVGISVLGGEPTTFIHIDAHVLATLLTLPGVRVIHADRTPVNSEESDGARSLP